MVVDKNPPTRMNLIAKGVQALDHALTELNQCVTVLKDVLEQIEAKEQPIPRGNRETYRVKASENYDVTGTKVVGFTLRGTKYVPNGHAWNNFVFSLCEILNDNDSRRFRSALWNGECAKWFSPSPKNRYWLRVDGTDVYVRDGFTALNAQEVAIELITRCGYKKDELTFELRDTPSKIAKGAK